MVNTWWVFSQSWKYCVFWWITLPSFLHEDFIACILRSTQSSVSFCYSLFHGLACSHALCTCDLARPRPQSNTDTESRETHGEKLHHKHHNRIFRSTNLTHWSPQVPIKCSRSSQNENRFRTSGSRHSGTCTGAPKSFFTMALSNFLLSYASKKLTL